MVYPRILEDCDTKKVSAILLIWRLPLHHAFLPFCALLPFFLPILLHSFLSSFDLPSSFPPFLPSHISSFIFFHFLFMKLTSVRLPTQLGPILELWQQLTSSSPGIINKKIKERDNAMKSGEKEPLIDFVNMETDLSGELCNSIDSALTSLKKVLECYILTLIFILIFTSFVFHFFFFITYFSSFSVLSVYDILLTQYHPLSSNFPSLLSLSP